MVRLISLLLLAFSLPAVAAPWQTRWALAGKQEAGGYYVARFVPSGQQQGVGGAAAWVTLTAYSLNALAFNTAAPCSGCTYQVTVAGTSGATGGPSCSSGTCSDGTVTWKFIGQGIFPTARVATSSMSQVTWRFTPSAIYNSSQLAFTCPSSSPFTPCSATDVQINMEVIATAGANVLAVRTRWVVDQKEIVINGYIQNYPYRIRLIPDASAAGLADNGTNLDAASGVGATPSIDVVIWSTIVFDAVTIGTPVYVDFGGCTGSCLTTL